MFCLGAYCTASSEQAGGSLNSNVLATSFYSGWIVYFLYAPSHTAFASLTFTSYSQVYVNMCNISHYYDGSSCKSCYSKEIFDCSGPSYNNAYSCEYPLTLCNGICYCYKNYYWNGTACSACNSLCFSCNGPLSTDCLLYSNNSQVCINGYFNTTCLLSRVTYNSCFPCDPSCFSCSGPSSNQCSACVQNATLQSNKTCKCSQGWAGSPPLCTRNYFTASLSVNASDVASIVFSEPLAQQLTYSNLSVFINNLKQDFSIQMIDSLTYLVKIVFVENVTQNSSLEISILGSFFSLSNSLLSNYKLNAALYARKMGGIQECFESAYNNCYTCAFPMTLWNSICYCNNSFYWDGTTCSACSSSCLVYNGSKPGDCLLKTKSLSNVCSDGYFYYSCDSATYYNCFPCDPSCFDCTGPLSNECTSCIHNATLQSNGACSCSQGWSGVPPVCIRNYFTAVLSVNASDAATIIFSEPLEKQLSYSNLSVFLNNIQQDFSITMVDESSWIIQPVYLEDVAENSKLEILMLGFVVSKNNSLLSTLSLTSTLYPLKSQILAQKTLAQQLATMRTTTKQASEAMGIVLASVCLLNFDLLFLFQFLNAGEMYFLIQFFDMDIDPLFSEFITTMQISFKLPSMFDYFVNSSEGVVIPIKYKNIGFNTNLILINSGTNLTILLGIIVILLILFMIKRILWVFKKKVKVINISLVVKVFTLFWIQTISDLSINSFIGIYLAKFENITQVIDFSCCFFALVILN